MLDDQSANHPQDAPGNQRTPVVLVTGLDASSIHRVGDALECGGVGSVQVHHDLTQVEDGRVVLRRPFPPRPLKMPLPAPAKD